MLGVRLDQVVGVCAVMLLEFLKTRQKKKGETYTNPMRFCMPCIFACQFTDSVAGRPGEGGGAEGDLGSG